MVNSLEFRAKIKQGIIQIPVEYQQELLEDDEVIVILMKQPKRISQTGIMVELTENPIAVQGIRKLTRDDIYQL